MELKQYNRYRMQFNGKWASASVICMGASLFLLAVYYFGLRSFNTIGFAECLFSLVLPLVLCIAYIVFIRFLRLNSPGMFAILGAAFCLMLLIGTFSSGNVLRIVLGCIWYILCALVLLACAGGFLPGKLPASMMFCIAFVVRILFFDLRLKGLAAWVYEASVLLLILSLCFLPVMFRPGKSKE